MSVVITDRDGDIDYVNPFFSTLTGYEKDEVLGENPRVLQSGETSPAVYHKMWKTILGGHSWRGELINKKKNGELYTELAQVSPIFDVNGNVTHFVAVKQDVTKRKRADQLLQESEERYRQLVEYASDAVYRISLNGFFEYVNPQAEGITGYARDELIGKSFTDIIHPRWKRRVQEFYLDQRDRAISETTFQFPIFTKCGEEKWVEQTVNVIEKHGEPIGLQGIVRDVTERVKASEKLKMRNRMLQALHSVTLDIGSATNILSLFSRIMHNAVDLLDANQGGCLLLFDAQQNLLLIIEGVGVGEILVGKFQRPGLGIAGQVFQTAKPHISQECRLLEEGLGRDAVLALNSILGVPLISDGDVIGVLILFADAQRRNFSSEDVTVTEMFAAQASVAYRNIELYERTERELAERKLAEEREREQRALAEALRDTAMALNSSLDLDEVITKILDKVGSVVPYTAMSIVWVDGGKLRHLRLLGFDSEQEQWLTGQSFTVDDFATYQQVIKSRKPLVIQNTEADSRWAALPATRWIHSHIEAPVIIDGKVVAIINLDSNEPDFYTSKHAEKLQVFTNQVATAIQNAMLYEEVQSLATVDELTGLYNRRGFFEVCRREVGRLQRFRRSFSVLFVDIDHFKQFNDRYSYEIGDMVLRMVAETLQIQVREVDVVGRYGGEEMIVLLPEINQTGAMDVAGHLRATIEGLQVPSEHGELKITVSIGVATLVPEKEKTIPLGAELQAKILDELIGKAGQALHTAKQQGRNQVVAYKGAG